MILSVLPPIQTTGLTTADVPALSNHVRDLMLDTLGRISRKVPEQREKSEERAPETEIVPPITVPTNTVERVTSSVEEVPTESSTETPPSPSTTGSVHSIRRTSGSENGTETEEDEGMVLVGHPSV
jgi:lysophosphatidate acyltransferase